MAKFINKGNITIVLASAFLAFGIYNVHDIAPVTEGGIIGLTLLLDELFNISPGISSFILSGLCYIYAYRYLGKKFILLSLLSTISFSITYAFLEIFTTPIFPQIEHMPLLASIVGAIFVGVGAGFCVLNGAANSGDDALAMTLSFKYKLNIQNIYLISDISVLLLSLIYIPLDKILYSLLTVIISGQIIGWIQKLFHNVI